jgi:quinol monooxygenase YgiN
MTTGTSEQTRYGFLATMRTRPGRRDDVVSILLDGVGGLRDAGCHAYIISVSEDDEDAIHVMEVWETKEHHDASLKLAETQAAIAKAMPLLTGEFSTRELRVVGGLGAGQLSSTTDDVG